MLDWLEWLVGHAADDEQSPQEPRDRTSELLTPSADPLALGAPTATHTQLNSLTHSLFDSLTGWSVQIARAPRQLLASLQR